jgi:hypothetical protein
MKECEICKGEKDVISLPLYLHGSEGVNLCLNCRIRLINYISDLTAVNFKGFKEGFKKGRKENT